MQAAGCRRPTRGVRRRHARHPRCPPGITAAGGRRGGRLRARLCKRVVRRALDQDGDAVRVAHALHERVLLLAQHVLVHQARMAQRVRRQLLHAVDREAWAAGRGAVWLMR